MRTWNRILPSLVAAALLALPTASLATGNAPVCEVIDFDSGLLHGDFFEGASLFGGDLVLTLDAFRNSPPGPAIPRVYDTEFYDANRPPPNSTHEDTQRAFLCNDAANGGNGNCDGLVLMIPDEGNFFVQADDTQGGLITIDGFDGDFEITSYSAVDSDGPGKDIILRVGPGLVEVGRSSALGNGSVETVITDDHIFSTSAQFEFQGSGAIDDIEICRVAAPFCGDGVLDANEECDDGNNENGDGCSAACTVEPPTGGQGCTPGYWKQEHHFFAWETHVPGDEYEAVFGVDASHDPTLIEALHSGGGGEIALGRHAVAALLNAESSDVDYFDTPSGVIDRVREAYATGDFEGVKNVLAEQNEAGCPLGNGKEPGDDDDDGKSDDDDSDSKSDDDDSDSKSDDDDGYSKSDDDDGKKKTSKKDYKKNGKKQKSDDDDD